MQNKIKTREEINIKKTRSKRMFSAILALSVVMLIGASSAAAYDTYYDGWIGGNQWTWIGNANTKSNDYSYFYVKETYANKSNFHTKYRLTNSEDKPRGAVTVDKNSKNSWVRFNSTCSRRYYYFLDGKRENLVDPATNVAGWFES